MPKILITALVVSLSGCSVIANHYDRMDPCQTRAELGRPQGYQMPDWCGASGGRLGIYDRQGRYQGYIQTR